MIRKTVFLLAAGWLASVSLAAAQTIDNGTEVRVNPVPAGRSEVLLYPGGTYMRVVPPLLEPGERRGAVHLHMPAKRAARPRSAEGTVAAAAPESSSGYKPGPEFGAPAPKQQTKPQAKPKPAPAPKVATAAPPPQPSSGYSPGPDFGSMPMKGGGLFRYTGPSAPAQKPAPQSSAPQSSAPQSSAPKSQVARAEPPPAETHVPGLTKQSIILFAHDAPDPAESALSNIKLLATQLNAAMQNPGSRVQIQAYGGPKGDKGSDARRLSLKRALAIRQVLIDDGVPAERIDVRAMGGVDDSGPTDRVDVYTKA
jgi:outer membrane protein OmpA-like peptidoglycan-associated protein